jgi:hypothetical protein
VNVGADAIIFALGGASWPQLGSDGAWTKTLSDKGIGIAALKPANCGFDVGWSEHLRAKFAGAPVKPVAINGRQGEFIVTETGVEGGLIYSVSAAMREEIAAKGVAILRADLRPEKSERYLSEALSRPRGRASFATYLRKATGLEGVKAALVRELVSETDRANPQALAAAIKSLPIPLRAARPIAEAISSAGGVRFTELDNDLMVRALPGVFVAGEMLDWEAPTGGYLLTACFSSGRAAGLGAVNWLNSANQVATKKTAKAEAKLETVEVAAKPARKAAKPKVAVEVVDVTSAPAPTEQAAPVVKPKRASKVKVAEVEIETEVKAAKSKRAVKAKTAPEAEVIVIDAAEIVAEVAKPKRTRKATEPAAPVASEADAVPAKPKRVRKTSQE